ncbi:uncharacterized protein CDAR_274481 [Caerostris darwini]|uniref:SH3 domain-containing protein n=1 Tax=Caerostris darwini TaxID=1538125 RepID=A0AAV4RI37_9ARAC|nr:uncharacterized protein CDAR_274481 [Caerostris darwini]
MIFVRESAKFIGSDKAHLCAGTGLGLELPENSRVKGLRHVPAVGRRGYISPGFIASSRYDIRPHPPFHVRDGRGRKRSHKTCWSFNRFSLATNRLKTPVTPLPVSATADDRASDVDAPRRSGEVEADDPRCQLEHCTFCDFRVCCQVESVYNKEAQELQSEPCLRATENPAYGLSAKNWLETSDDQEDEAVSETMEPSFSDARQSKDPTNGYLSLKNTSQPDRDCDGATIPMKMNPISIPSQSYSQTNAETRSQRSDAVSSERPKPDKASDPKHGGLTWSVLKHRQLVGEAPENCDKPNSCVIEHSISDILPDPQFHSHEKGGSDTKVKRNAKDRSFPLSLMKPTAKMGEKKSDISQQQHAFKSDLTRQRPVQKASCSKFAPAPNRGKMDDLHRKSASDILGAVNNPLSTIEQIKTEESIQEWLARISDSSNGICDEDSEENGKPTSSRSAWDISDLKEKETLKNKLRNETAQVINKGLQEALEISHSKNYPNNTESKPHYDADYPSRDDENTDAVTLLYNASKASPANIPMVVMQCSRLHSHIGSKPPFQQTSLPMGTLVTALYQESDWLYVQTPHGVEGFIIASNCVPIGTTNDPGHTSRRPWEPCDFPIEINVRRKCEFGRQQGAYIPAKMPTTNSKQAAPYVNTVKMKTNFYSDRYFSHTFKSKDSIKTAKTVTDILRNSPETKVSNQ